MQVNNPSHFCTSIETSTPSAHSSRVTFTQQQPSQPVDVAATNAMICVGVVALSVVAFCAIAGYRKHKATLIQQRIQHLNQL